MKQFSDHSAIKIAIVGNCQVRPLAEILAACARVDNEIAQIIVHLSKDDSAAENDKLLENADLILSQLVASNYPVSHVTTDAIKERYPDKVVVWPNVFFHGQNPDLFYATGEQNSRLFGPLDVYHSRSLIELWKQERMRRKLRSIIIFHLCTAVNPWPNKSIDHFMICLKENCTRILR